MITDHCGSISPATPDIRHHGSAVFTAAVTGPVELEMNNWRSGAQDDPIENYIDNLFVLPQDPNFETSVHDISIFTGGSSNLALSAGVGHAGRDYMILSGVTGTWPGFSLSGIGIPLNPDAWTFAAFSLINSPFMTSFMGTLDMNGQAQALFDSLGPLPLEAVGLAMYFDYVVLENPGSLPAIFASHPLYILFTW